MTNSIQDKKISIKHWWAILSKSIPPLKNYSLGVGPSLPKLCLVK